MKSKQLLFLIVAVLLMFPLFQVSADPPVTFDILTTFDYPMPHHDTFASGINDRGDVVGQFNRLLDVFGYVRFADGDFSDPILDPNDVYGETYATSINAQRTVSGFYGASGFPHGFILTGGTFTDLVVNGSSRGCRK